VGGGVVGGGLLPLPVMRAPNTTGINMSIVFIITGTKSASKETRIYHMRGNEMTMVVELHRIATLSLKA